MAHLMPGLGTVSEVGCGMVSDASIVQSSFCSIGCPAGSVLLMNSERLTLHAGFGPALAFLPVIHWFLCHYTYLSVLCPFLHDLQSSRMRVGGFEGLHGPCRAETEHGVSTLPAAAAAPGDYLQVTSIVLRLPLCLVPCDDRTIGLHLIVVCVYMLGFHSGYIAHRACQTHRLNSFLKYCCGCFNFRLNVIELL